MTKLLNYSDHLSINQSPVKAYRKISVRSLSLVMVVIFFAIVGSQPGLAQTQDESVVLTLNEAIQIALVQNLALQNTKLDLRFAEAQVKEGWAELFPLIEFNSSYTRNVRSANPFAGSQAGGLFETLGFLDWLTFNEQARTDSDGETNPISVQEFFFRQAQGYKQAGVVLDTGDNPFSVPNVYLTGLSIEQKLFDGRIILGAVGASKWLGPFNALSITREEQVLVEDVKSAWYGALLAEEQERVVELSVARAKRTLQEVSRQVAQGTTPKFQRLSAEVEVSNLETQLVLATVESAASRDVITLLLGIPADLVLDLRGNLESDLQEELLLVSPGEATRVALEKRPDLEQAIIGIELEKIQLQVAKADYLPNLSAFANFNWLGNVPDNRQIVSSLDGDPFSFTTSQNGYFHTSYWDRSVSVGFRLSWNIFNGLATHQRIQQRKISVQQAKNNVEFLHQSIRVEVEQSLRSVRAARTRIVGQRRNVARAELNFEYAEARLKEGVATPLEVREASDQLDLTRLNYLQAVHDYLVAFSKYETSVGGSAQYGS